MAETLLLTGTPAQDQHTFVSVCVSPLSHSTEPGSSPETSLPSPKSKLKTRASNQQTRRRSPGHSVALRASIHFELTESDCRVRQTHDFCFLRGHSWVWRRVRRRGDARFIFVFIMTHRGKQNEAPSPCFKTDFSLSVQHFSSLSTGHNFNTFLQKRRHFETSRSKSHFRLHHF